MIALDVISPNISANSPDGTWGRGGGRGRGLFPHVRPLETEESRRGFQVRVF